MTNCLKYVYATINSNHVWKVQYQFIPAEGQEVLAYDQLQG